MFFKPEWVNGNGIVDEFAATRKICNYIKDNWNLDMKYRYTVEKMDTSHAYKVNLFHTLKALGTGVGMFFIHQTLNILNTLYTLNHTLNTYI